MAWFYLICAGLFECVWAIGLKYTDGFTRLIPSVLTVLAMIASFYLMSVSIKSIPLGTAYAVWTGIGAVGVAALGMIFLGEPRELLRISCLILITTGILGLKLLSPGQ